MNVLWCCVERTRCCEAVLCVQSGDQAATIIALCSLQDMNLYNVQCQLSIIDAGGIEVLINLLESGNTKGMVCGMLPESVHEMLSHLFPCHSSTGIL